MDGKNIFLEKTIWTHHQNREFEQAATVALKGYGPELLSFIFVLVNDKDTASEIFSQVCEELWKSIESFKGKSSFKTWVYSIARYTTFRFIKNPHRRFFQPLGPLSAYSILVDQIRTATLPFLRTDVKDRVRNLRQRLSQEEQTLLSLRIDQGMSWREVSEVMCSPTDKPEEDEIQKTAALYRKRLERIKARLRELAKSEGLLELGLDQNIFD